jgi:hypothetical protein
MSDKDELTAGLRAELARVNARIGCVNHDCDKCKAVQEPAPKTWELTTPATALSGGGGSGIVEVEWFKRPAPVQEPVAWGIIASNTGRICQVELDADEVEGHNPKHIVPLYTTQPAAQKPWVGLTADEMLEALTSVDPATQRLPVGFSRFACAIEAKLREKNGGAA